ncbi:hypothetical protein MNEG_5136 [Monoraphidium neglectum]|uniref:EF-hand domain-containing protein n=1 Tax=Monoraphidium neglectum TaxID=145388 RepID=A0A0D2MQX5_9CHLO|nr:hypothetical protein MNEG_5136 [Monoraphidium neglectum]KIZ02822.1 hypothetical protein MNEG_5136 [Monoraphidium neglectum]|eukprot:XP_013901841.1 hypothetical protein MNEG_5136 [Monoraphidium neglectum]
MKPAGSIQPPGAGPSPAALRTKSGHEVALHQQVEALTLEATSPHLTQQCSSAKSATSSGPSLLGSVSNLPIPRVESQRPWFWARLDSAAVALTEVRVDAGGLDDVAEGDVELTSPPAEAQPLCDQQQQHRQQQREQHEQQHQREQQRQRDAAARAAAASPAPESVADGAGARGGEQGAEASRAANAVAAKTFSALVRKYAALSEEEEAAQLKLAGKFGKGLFENCRRDPRAPGVTLEDFLPFFPDDTAAAQAFDFFDKDGDGFISKAEMKEAVTAIVAERRDMATSLRDTDSIVASLEAFLAGLVHLTFIAFYLLVWDINVMSGFSTFSATVLALTFVFGESVKNVFQSAVWLFGNHALDVGDTIMMPPDDTWHRVKKFGLVDTVLVRENGDLVHVPNNKLWTAPIVNLTRSGRRTDITRILIDTDAPSKARDVLRDALVAHCAGPGKGDFVGEPRVRFSGLTPEGKSRLSISWTYTFGATDARYAVVRDSILAVMKDALGGFGAMHTLPVRSMPQHHKSD